MTNKGKYYITTAIAYTSGKPHIGNSYEIVLADSIARFKRKDGYDVFFQTGTQPADFRIGLELPVSPEITPSEFVQGIRIEMQIVAAVVFGNCSSTKFRSAYAFC